MSTSVLVPELKPGDIVVMDNLSSHKRLQRSGRRSRRRAPRFGSFLPIARTSTPSRKRSRGSRQCSGRLGERTVSGLWDLIGKLVDIFQPDECANYFRSCGYDPE
jgi:hypothetical protein